jgi:5-methylcytosine-specific restriction endonuclease McrA
MPRTDILERKDDILQWIQEERPKCYMCQKLHRKQETLNSYLQKMGIEYKGQQSKKGQQKGPNKYKPSEYYLNGNQFIASAKLKIKLIRDGLKEDKCEICGVSIWQGIKLPLELHHKDGNHMNNNLDNLQILCPNCHSIQEGNSGANIGKYTSMGE